MDRTRLTITIRKDLLQSVDSTIDKKNVRNRSHAIEVLVGKALSPDLHTAFVLAGGRGIKMRPLTYEIPKALIPVKGRPLLAYSIDLLQRHGFRDIILLVGHLGEKIREHFGDGSRYGVKIRYVEEGKENGTAAPLRLAERWLSEPFLLMYGDVLVDLNLRDLANFHLNQNALATLALTSVDDPSPFGVVRCHGSRVVEFLEKPKGRGRSHLVFSGISMLNPKVIDLVPKNGAASLEQDVLPKLVAQNQLAAFPFEGLWYDVGTPEVYERVLKEWPDN